MTLVTAGSFVWPVPLTDNQRDWRVLRALSEDWPDIRVFVRAGGPAHVRWTQAGITCDYLPSWRPSPLGRLTFVLGTAATVIGMERRHPVGLFAASDPLSGLAGWLVKRLAGVPVLLHLQGELIRPPAAYGNHGRRQTIGAVTRWLCRRVDAIRVVHAGQVDEVAALGVRAERVFVVGSRCDTTQYAREHWVDQGASTRQALAADAGFVAVYVGSLLEGKGLHVAFEAWSQVIDRLPDARFVVVGDGPFRLELEAAADRLGVSHAVRFVGSVPYDQVPGYLAAADVFLFPSFSEGSPRAVIEAMSMSLPVVATRVGGIPYLVEDGRSGLLAEPGDPRALSDRLLELAEDPVRRQSIAATARDTAVRRFDFAAVMQQMRELYRRVAREDSGRPAARGSHR